MPLKIYIGMALSSLPDRRAGGVAGAGILQYQCPWELTSYLGQSNRVTDCLSS